MNDYSYDDLHHLAIGRMGEYWTKYALTMHGLDVYTSEVDNKGIDFVVRQSQSVFHSIQVKSIRRSKTSYVFITKENEWEESKLSSNLWLALVLFENSKQPELYLIPASTWLKPDGIFKDKEYSEKQKSKPEWGLNVSKKNLTALEQFKVGNQMAGFREGR